LKWLAGLPESMRKKVDRIISLLERMDENIEAFAKSSVRRDEARAGFKHVAGIDVLSLDGHLQKTILELLRLGKGTATEVAAKTRRSRALESLYLNQLTQMGYVAKERVGKTVRFSIPR